jgi:hypothetical protein
VASARFSRSRGVNVGGRFCRRDQKKKRFLWRSSFIQMHPAARHCNLISRHRHEMDGFKKKRKLVATGDSKLPEKKQKTRDQPKKPSKKPRRSVAADSLRWRSANLPDMFDDAEGFYGLEEVDDVEVIRHADNTLEFVRLAMVDTWWTNGANWFTESN